MRFSDEIVVVENGSTDGTVRIARRHRVRLFHDRLDGFGPAKNRAIARARHSWILNIDADEVVTPTLRREIERVLRDNGPADAYDMPRRNHYFGRWLRHGGKYPDRQVRLFRRGRARFNDKRVHERLAVAGRVGRLAGDLDHFPYRDLATFFAKPAAYAALEAGMQRAAGVQPTFAAALRWCLFRPARRFTSRYILKLGFLDGLPGFLACVHDAVTQILVYAHLKGSSRRTA